MRCATITGVDPSETPAGATSGSPAHRRGFWSLAVGFAALMAFTTIPTTMYPVYQDIDHFPTFMITVIFAAYGLGVMAGLFFVGHLSDHFGRRKVLVSAIAVEVISALIFICSTQVSALLAARFLCGFGIGAVTSTATAALLELRARAAPDESPRLATTVASGVNLGGLALGPLIGGIFTQWAPRPLTSTFVVFLGLLLAVGVMVVAIPETVAPHSRRFVYRPQRLQVDPRRRGEFLAAGVAAAGAFAVMGFFTSLTGTFVGGSLRINSHFVVGLTVFAMMGASAVSQVLLARLTLRHKVAYGLSGMVAGLIALAVSGAVLSFPLFLVAAVVAGAGVGLVFSAAIETAGAISDRDHRGETIAGMFLAAYVGITLPVIAVGVALTWFAAPTVLIVFALIVLVVVTASTSAMIRQTPG